MKIMMLLLTLSGYALCADPVFVHLTISAPENWQQQITAELSDKLNAIPEIEVHTESKCDDCVIDIVVDVNSVSLKKANETVGYSYMAVIYSNFDSNLATGLWDEVMSKNKWDSSDPLFKLFRTAMSGNVAWGGFVHTHGSLPDIYNAYDMTVARLKSGILKNYRTLLGMIQQIDTKPAKSLPTRKIE